MLPKYLCWWVHVIYTFMCMCVLIKRGRICRGEAGLPVRVLSLNTSRAPLGAAAYREVQRLLLELQNLSHNTFAPITGHSLQSYSSKESRVTQLQQMRMYRSRAEVQRKAGDVSLILSRRPAGGYHGSIGTSRSLKCATADQN